MVRVMNSFGVMVMVRVRVGIRVYVKPFCSAAKPQKPKSRENLGERISKSPPRQEKILGQPKF